MIQFAAITRRCVGVHFNATRKTPFITVASIRIFKTTHSRLVTGLLFGRQCNVVGRQSDVEITKTVPTVDFDKKSIGHVLGEAIAARRKARSQQTVVNRFHKDVFVLTHTLWWYINTYRVQIANVVCISCRI